jgi:hypothetical protein
MNCGRSIGSSDDDELLEESLVLLLFPVEEVEVVHWATLSVLAFNSCNKYKAVWAARSNNDN